MRRKSVQDVSASLIVGKRYKRTMVWKERIVLAIAVFVLHAPSAWGQPILHTTTRYEDAELEEFSYPNCANYTKLVIDNANNQLLVGAREYIFQVNLDNITNFKVIPWKSDNKTKERCKKILGKPTDQCYNFIKEIVLTDGTVLVCGTNSHSSSRCSWRNSSDISKNVNLWWTPRFGLNPDPHSNNTGILSDLGRFYYGKSKYSSSAAIVSNGFKRSDITQLVLKDEFLNDPNFVKSFAIGQYIYFFFREIAIENRNCGKVRFSRVARLCKGDVGTSMRNYFVTFMKARLHCMIPGEFPFYFNEIQDVYWDEKSQTFFAVFSSQPNGLLGSAVCAYSMNETEKVFSGDYKIQRTRESQWQADPNAQHFPNCKIKQGSLVSLSRPKRLKKGMMATKYLKLSVVRYLGERPLMYNAVATTTNGAQFVHREVGFTGIAVDEVGGNTVIYVSTDGGSVLRLFTPPGKPTCILEEIIMFKDNEKEVIKTLQIDKNKGALYTGSNRKLIKLKLARCERHHDYKSCIEAHDPYCVWSRSLVACIPLSSATAADEWVQDLSKCPQPKVTAQWSRWNEWTTCEQPDGNVCLCRSRHCIGTVHNLTQCEGHAMEVANCTVLKKKGWRESKWLVEGVTHGGWGAWSNWTTCTRGVGFKVKHRRCNNPTPRNGGRPCVGHDRRKKCCKLKPQTTRKQIPTPYVRIEKQNTALQFLVRCTAVGGEVTNISLDVIGNKTVDCTRRGKDCYGYLPGVWSEWRDWGPCKMVGRMYRTRTCPPGERCIGVNRQEQECIPVSKQTTEKPLVVSQTTIGIDIAVWGSWSPCSCTSSVKLINQSMGIRHRVLRCREMCSVNNPGCPRDKIEYTMCPCGKADVEARKSDTQENTFGHYEIVGFSVAGCLIFILLCLPVIFFVMRKKRKFNVSRRHEKTLNEDSSSEKYYGQTNKFPSVSSTKSHSDRYSLEMKERTPFIKKLFTRKAKDKPVFQSVEL